MFESTVIRSSVFIDSSGTSFEIPVILTSDGPLEILLDYFLDQWDHRSAGWKVKVCHSVRLFLEHRSATDSSQNDVNRFQNFRLNLLTGTVNGKDKATDGSNLWWSARSRRQVNTILVHLTDLFLWWSDKTDAIVPLPTSWRGSKGDAQLAEAAFKYRRHQAFLGHTWSTTTESARRNGSRSRAPQYRLPAKEKEAPLDFPDENIAQLCLEGFRVGKRLNLRDVAITLLLNGAGFRLSEPFHLYLTDVIEDPAMPGSALVLIHHPEQGEAPRDPRWLDMRGKEKSGHRAQYLAERFGLSPRNWLLSGQGAGWKGGTHESRYSRHYKQAYWFVPEFGMLFWKVWNLYVEQVQRISIEKRNHPYAFVNTIREPIGQPYSISSYEQSHARAVQRIGLRPSLQLGTHIHGHRHAYAQRLRRAGIPDHMIRRFLHHTDVTSQQTYTQPSQDECLAALKNGLYQLDARSDHLRSQLIL